MIMLSTAGSSQNVKGRPTAIRSRRRARGASAFRAASAARSPQPHWTVFARRMIEERIGFIRSTAAALSKWGVPGTQASRNTRPALPGERGGKTSGAAALSLSWTTVRVHRVDVAGDAGPGNCAMRQGRLAVAVGPWQSASERSACGTIWSTFAVELSRRASL
jgi:hypothetical protein